MRIGFLTGLLLTGCTLGACAWLDFSGEPSESISASLIDTDHAVAQLLSGRRLDAVEGAWEHEGSAFEIVISRNTFDVAPGFDYVGIMTRPDRPDWQHGDVKLMLRKTAVEGVFDGIWLTENHAKRAMTFVAEDRNLIQASFVSNDGHGYYVRIRRMAPQLASTG